MGKKKHARDVPAEFPKNSCLVFTQRSNLVVFSILIILAFIVMITAGAIYSKLRTYHSILSVTIPVGFIVISLFLLLTSVLAIIGIKKNWMRPVQAAVAFLIILIIIEFAIGGATAALSGKIKPKMRDWWTSADPSDINQIQTQLNCCGFDSNQDLPGPNCFVNQTTVREMKYMISEEIYTVDELIIDSLERPVVRADVIDKQGCQPALTALFQKQLKPLAAVGLVFTTLQLIALIFIIAMLVVLYREKNRSYLEV